MGDFYKKGFRQIRIEIPDLSPAEVTVTMLTLVGGKLVDRTKRGVRRFYSLEVMYDNNDGAYLHVPDLHALLKLYAKMKAEDAESGEKCKYRFYAHEITERKDEKTGKLYAVDIMSVGKPHKRTNGKLEFVRRITTAKTY